MNKTDNYTLQCPDEYWQAVIKKLDQSLKNYVDYYRKYGRKPGFPEGTKAANSTISGCIATITQLFEDYVGLGFTGFAYNDQAEEVKDININE